MATVRLYRFGNPAALKTIHPAHLVALLVEHSSYLKARGLDLSDGNPGRASAAHEALAVPYGSAEETSNGLDYALLSAILMDPDEHTPKKLVDALYYVHELATAAGMDELLAAIETASWRDSINLGEDPTPADVAVQVYLQDPDLLERKHAEHLLERPRSFDYFQSKEGSRLEWKSPTKKQLSALKFELDDWFEKRKRRRTARVFIFPRSDGIWFLVRHGEPLKREGALEGEESSSIHYRPEKHDVLVYDPLTGEIRINACSKKEQETYRSAFGLHLFGAADRFPGTAKYTLEPLREKGEASLTCSDVDGMDWAKLKEIHFFWGPDDIEIRKSSDYFALLKRKGRSMPEKARIIRASIQVKFTESKTPRTVTIRPPNIASYTRDDDAAIVERWLTDRCFIRAAPAVEDANT